MSTRVIVRTIAPKTGALLLTREYDFKEKPARDLVLRHIIHCVNNGKGVAIINVEDENA